jgi:uncharacterized protein with ATP-grasp and redox domains
VRPYLGCLPCFSSEAIRAVRIATDDEKRVKNRLNEVGMLLKTLLSAKGEKFEALSNEKRPIFFLSKVKLRVIAWNIGVTEGDIPIKGMLSRRASEHGSQDADEGTQSKNAA